MRRIIALACSFIASIGCFNVTAADYNNIQITGHVALITDMSQAMEFVWDEGDIDAETLKKGCFVQVLGEYYITDGNGVYFSTTKYNDSWGYGYDWSEFGDGSLAKYGPSYMNTYSLVEANAQVPYSFDNRVVYFQYDAGAGMLKECTLRNYIGHYDWHDFYLQGYARTFEGTDANGAYDYSKVKDDPLSQYVYNANNPSEYKDSIPLFFNENPYQVDGPCVLMYKGEPWPLKLTEVLTYDESDAETQYTDPGTPWRWEYETSSEGDTINLQAGVYIFFLSYYNQKDEPVSLTAMRVDFGRFFIIDNDTLAPAEPYEVVQENPTPTVVTPTQMASGDIVLSSYYSWETKERKYRYKDYVTPYGNSRKMVWYNEYHTHSSDVSEDYPVIGLAEELNYSGCIAIPWGNFSDYYLHSNHGTLIVGGNKFNVTAEKDKGVPVVIYRPSLGKILAVTYMTYERYREIKADVAPIRSSSGPAIIYDLNGRQVNEADMQTGRIYIRNRRPMILR